MLGNASSDDNVVPERAPPRRHTRDRNKTYLAQTKKIQKNMIFPSQTLPVCSSSQVTRPASKKKSEILDMGVEPMLEKVKEKGER